MPFRPLWILLEWSTGIYICCSPIPPARGARDETVLSWDVPPRVAERPPTLEGTIGRGRVTTERVPLHRVGHGPQFPAAALMAPLGPSPLAPLRLPTAFESEWTQVLSGNFLRLFFNSTPSLVGRLRSERLAVWVWSQGSVLGSDWPPRDCRQCGRRTGTEGERRLYTRAPALACETFQSKQFSSESYCFFQRGLIGALVSGEVWRSRWLCMVKAFHSGLAPLSLDPVAVHRHSHSCCC